MIDLPSGENRTAVRPMHRVRESDGLSLLTIEVRSGHHFTAGNGHFQRGGLKAMAAGPVQ